MSKTRNEHLRKFAEQTKVVRLPESLATFLQQYPSVVTELVRQIKDGELNLSIDVTGCNSVTNDIDSKIDDALNSKIKDLREEFEEHEAIMVLRSQKAFEEQIKIFRVEMDEAIASAKKPLLSVMREKVIAA